jgi:hypothetical protein
MAANWKQLLRIEVSRGGIELYLYVLLFGVLLVTVPREIFESAFEFTGDAAHRCAK